mgnify:CR=1 FL=1
MKILPILLFLAIFPSASGLAGGHRSMALVPENGKPVTLVVGGNERDYYLLAPGAPVRLQIDGPGKLNVVSRLILPKDGHDVQQYTIRVMQGDDTLKLHATQTDKSDASFKASQGVPGKSRKFTLKIPEKSFTCELWVDGAPRGAAVRLLFTPAKGTKKLVAIEPLSYDRIVTAVIKENLLAYYVSSREHAVKLRVVGPTKVKVSLRLNYDKRMNGEQKYAVVISEGQNRLAQWSLKTTKSDGIVYQEWKEVVPGKLNSASLDVPAGEHLYNITLGEATATSVSLNFSVPEADLTNEE